MKKIYSGELRFITPAFLSGANQGMTEIRVPSIRGELRWWFRALGATLADETAVFGGVHGGAIASAVVIRVSKEKLVGGPEIVAPPNSAKGYLYYFATVSGKTKGIRSAAGHYADVGSFFHLDILLRSQLESVHEQMLINAVGLFLRYGSLGLRATRGCGAFTATDMPAVEDAALGKFTIGKVSSETFSSGVKCQLYLGGVLRDLRRKHHLSAKDETALGYSMGAGSRCASALHLRPVEVNPGVFAPYLVYTDAACRKQSIRSVVENLIH